MDTIETRSARLEDLPILYAFEQGIVEAERPYDSTLKDGEIHYYNLEELIAANNAEVVVAVIGNELVGSGYIQITESKPYKKHTKHGYIGFMFVKPEHRCKGVSQVVTQAMIIWAKAQGLTEIKLEVYDENIAAVRAYQKAGLTKNLVEMRMEI